MLQFIDSFQMGFPGLSGTVSAAALAVAGPTLDLDFAAKRYNNALGPELLVNPEFATDISSWTPLASGGGNVAGVVWATGALSITGTGTGITGAYQAFATTAGKLYEVYIVPRPGQALNIVINDGSVPAGANIGPGGQVSTTPVTVRFTALSAASVLSFNRGGATTALLESVSVREVDPVNLGPELLTNPEFTTDMAGWSGSALTAGVATWSAGQVVIAPHTAGVSFGNAMTNTVAGRLYEASVTIVAWAGSAITLAVGTSGVGDTSLASRNISGVGEHKIQFIATDSTSQPFIYRGITTGNIVIERWSVREVNPPIESVLTVTRASPGMAETLSGQWLDFAANVPRITDKGVLREEARTNSVRNNTMVGAVVGSPGTLPTNWATGNNAGLSTQVIELGVENGVDYIDIRFFGTANLSTSYFLEFDGASMAAAVGVATAQSLFLKRIAGTIPPNFNLNTVMRNSSDGYLGDQFFTATPTADLRRYVGLGNAATVGTTQVRARLTWPVTNGQSYDFIVRMGLPQLELGGFATSPIKTSGTIATRMADSILTWVGPWLNPATGTLYAEAQNSDSVNPSPCIVSLDDTTGNERVQLRKAAIGNMNGIVVDGNVVQANPAPAGTPMANGAYAKNAIAYATNDVNGASAGVLAVQDTSVTIPTVTRMEIGMGVGVSPLNGYVKRVAYYPRRLTDAELVTLTT